MPVKFLMVNVVNHSSPIDYHHPPLGFGYIVSSLRSVFGDKIIFKVVDNDIAENIKTFHPDIVGITSVSKNYNLAREYAAVAKQSGTPVIIGGVHISFMPQTLTGDMDIAIDGEGEHTIIDLMSSFIANGKFEYSELMDIKGIIFRDNGKLVSTATRDLIKPLDDIPYPARDLMETSKSAHMLSSRGCPYHCVFCSTARYTRNQVRYAGAEYVAGEIEALYRDYKVAYITIYDDMFAMDCKRVIKIQELLSSKNLIGKFSVAVNIRADFITEELAEILRHMNVDVVALGVESGCQETLGYLKSGSLKVEDNANAIRILKKHHIIPYCSFIFGSPSEDMDSVLETIRFIKDNGIYYFDISVLTPFPGTPIWDYALSKGIVSEDMDWSKLNFDVSTNPIYLSEKLSLEEIAGICSQMANRKERYLKRLNILMAMKHPYRYIRDYLKQVLTE